jgi:hypothetical protein
MDNHLNALEREEEVFCFIFYFTVSGKIKVASCDACEAATHTVVADMPPRVSVSSSELRRYIHFCDVF